MIIEVLAVISYDGTLFSKENFYFGQGHNYTDIPYFFFFDNYERQHWFYVATGILLPGILLGKIHKYLFDL